MSKSRCRTHNSDQATHCTDTGAERCKLAELDLRQPLLFQVGLMGPEYWEWVHAPVPGAPRFFRSSLLEHCTKTPWWVVPLLWGPVWLAVAWQACASARAAAPWAVSAAAAAGLLAWQALEYAIHRYGFHTRPRGYWPTTLHFGFHGCHHKFPADAERLVFPPLPAALVALLLRTMTRLLLPLALAPAAFAGVLGGYLAYDCVHFVLHHARGRRGWLGALRKAHLDHHFRRPGAGFGISSGLFDRLLATRAI